MAIIGISISCGLILGIWILNNRIRIDREDRERHFVAVHFVAMESVMASEDEAPKTIKELMEVYAGGGVDSALLKPFRNGLTYRRTPQGFEIAEPQQVFVSLFRRDRLVASDRDWPHWESSGIKVWKSPGQQVPPNYLNTRAEQDVHGNTH
jgi:hypothetical protein